MSYILAVSFMLSCGGEKKAESPAPAEVQSVVDEVYVPTTPDGKPAVQCCIDTMDIKNPYIYYDKPTDSYYMTGDGGHIWVSKGLKVWEGPYVALAQDAASWVGASPVVTAPEIHKYNNRYYYMASFAREGLFVEGTDGQPFVRQSCTTLVADNITGPYKTVDSNANLLDEREMASHPTFCTDELGVGYMIYDHLAKQNGDGTVQIVRLTEDLGRRMGEAYVMFTASQNSWSKNVKGTFSQEMEAPYLFLTDTGCMGILFTTMMGTEPAVGVAYSSTGTLNGPWEIESEPLLKGVASSSIFKDYDGTPVMVVQKDTIIGGKDISVPRLLKLETQFDKLQIKGYYKF